MTLHFSVNTSKKNSCGYPGNFIQPVAKYSCMYTSEKHLKTKSFEVLH